MKLQDTTEPLDMESVRKTLSAENGKRFWRSLEELADTPQFRDFLHREFPREAAVWEDGPSRRSFLKLAGASMALAGLGSACARQPQEMIVPYVKQPEHMIPGKAMKFASAVVLDGYAQGTVVESHQGRPTKIEGNPEHPASQGASTVFTQATLLTMYDPDRNKAITQVGNPRPWEEFVAAMTSAMAAQESKRGAGLRILTPTVTSPTLADQIKSLKLNLPAATWHHYQSAFSDNARSGQKMAFGQYADAIYNFQNADIVVSLDSDFLNAGPGSVRYARDFAKRRSQLDSHDGDGHGLNRLYAIESTVTVTGGMADHRLPVKPSQVEAFARALANRLGVNVPAPDLADAFSDSELVTSWADEIAKDLEAHSGRAVVVPGDDQAPIVHALAHAINGSLGSIGAETGQGAVTYVSPVEAQPEEHTASLRSLVNAMNAGEVDTLVILGCNAVYEAPADLQFSEAMTKVPMRVYHGLYFDETADRCHWVIPATHELESWSDARSFDGTTSIIQPLIEPLYGGKTAHEVLSALLGAGEMKSHDIVKTYWRGRFGSEDPAAFERFWRTCLSKGVVSSEERAGVAPTAFPITDSPKTDYSDAVYTAPADGIEVLFRLDPTIHDGRFANNGWLQELPKPLSKVTWENAILMAPSTAEGLGLHGDDVVNLTVNGVTVEGTLWTQPGHPRDAVTVNLGYGRTKAGRIGDGIGFDGNLLRTSETMGFASGATIETTGLRRVIARTEQHHSIEYGKIRGMDDAMEAAERRELIRVATESEYHDEPRFAQAVSLVPDKEMTLYPEWKWEGHKWGMTIDLNTCTGCGACVVACQAENNIPVVGRQEVLNGREMHWIRVDRYYRGEDYDNPEVYHQPIPCMQCENAPCEVVCPVAATVHSAEGLNDMVYNRCVGTRYCSNNCPYKVRRFNFFHFSKMQYGGGDYESLKLMRNPNVTVRSRGVMEKCTYCVQRINAARIEAKNDYAKAVTAAGEDGAVPDDVRIDDGAIVTACQQACPANAITFGDTADPESAVSVAKSSPRNYGILSELNTRPRTTYLAKITNPNPALVKG